jgi:hypothetical protein
MFLMLALGKFSFESVGYLSHGAGVSGTGVRVEVLADQQAVPGPMVFESIPTLK